MCEGYIKLQDYHYLLIGLEMQKQGQQKEKQKNIKGLKKKNQRYMCIFFWISSSVYQTEKAILKKKVIRFLFGNQLYSKQSFPEV